MKQFLRFAFVFLLLATGCVKNNPKPSWVKINPFQVTDNLQLNEGQLELNDFSNAWIYADEKFVGVFELPCKFPILKYGDCTIKAYPTILNNGISATKKNYPFTAAHIETVHLSDTDTLEINPTTYYLSGTDFTIEDFEGGTTKFTSGNNTQTNLIVETEANGNRYARVYLTENTNLWTAYMGSTGNGDPFTFPIGTKVFLEFECKNTQSFVTTFIFGTQGGTINEQDNVRITTASNGWKKIYIELSELVNYSNASYFWFGFKCQLNENTTDATILIDNVKIISQ